MSRPLPIVVLIVAVAGLVWPVFSIAQLEVDASTRRQNPSTFMPIPRPPYPPGDGWVWVPPTYRTVYDRIWQPPTYQTITENVWISDQYRWQTICTWENGQPVQRQEWVLVSAHYETRTRQIQVSPGGWTWGPRQELVTPGHWEHVGPIPPHPGPVPFPQPQPQPPNTRPPGLEPFSPLWEWPADKK